MMYASASARKQNGLDVIRVLAVNDGCCTAPFHSDESCCQNKLCSFPINMLRVCFRKALLAAYVLLFVRIT